MSSLSVRLGLEELLATLPDRLQACAQALDERAPSARRSNLRLWPGRGRKSDLAPRRQPTNVRLCRASVARDLVRDRRKLVEPQTREPTADRTRPPTRPTRRTHTRIRARGMRTRHTHHPEELHDSELAGAPAPGIRWIRHARFRRTGGCARVESLRVFCIPDGVVRHPNRY
jgi:hypothetical protein